jgi:metal-dependent amidase/aminoacylase/carboxypeptidase family protein
VKNRVFVRRRKTASDSVPARLGPANPRMIEADFAVAAAVVAVAGSASRNPSSLARRVSWHERRLGSSRQTVPSEAIAWGERRELSTARQRAISL